jgi:archaellum component FlaC
MVERLTKIEKQLNFLKNADEKKLDILKNVDEKLDILAEGILGMRNEARELKTFSESLTNQISSFGNNSGVSELFIKVSIS